MDFSVVDVFSKNLGPAPAVCIVAKGPGKGKPMSNRKQHIRHGIGTVRPYIYGPVALLEFVKETFDAVELERHEFGPESFHVEMQIGDAVLVIEAGELPSDVSRWVGAVYVYVEDVDAVYTRAMKLAPSRSRSPGTNPTTSGKRVSSMRQATHGG